MTALDRAIDRRHNDVVTTLLKHGADVRATSWALASGKPEVTTQLLGKCLEIANSLYKSSQFHEATEMYARALKHVGEPASAGALANGHRLTGKQANMCAHLLLGYSRCQRKTGELDSSEVSSTRALELKPQWHEALYARARVSREKGDYQAALNDAVDAERFAPKQSLKEIQRLSERIREEMRRQVGVPSRLTRPGQQQQQPQQQPIGGSTDAMQVPGNQQQQQQQQAGTTGGAGRQRINSYTRAISNIEPGDISRSYQQLPTHMYHQPLQQHQQQGNNAGPQLQRPRSQDNLTESMMNLDMVGSGGVGGGIVGSYQEPAPINSYHPVPSQRHHIYQAPAGPVGATTGPVAPPRQPVKPQPQRYVPGRAAAGAGMAAVVDHTKSHFVTNL